MKNFLIPQNISTSMRFWCHHLFRFSKPHSRKWDYPGKFFHSKSVYELKFKFEPALFLPCFVFVFSKQSGEIFWLFYRFMINKNKVSCLLLQGFLWFCSYQDAHGETSFPHLLCSYIYKAFAVRYQVPVCPAIFGSVSSQCLEVSMVPLNQVSEHSCMICCAFGDAAQHLYREPFHFVFSAPVLSRFNFLERTVAACSKFKDASSNGYIGGVGTAGLEVDFEKLSRDFRCWGGLIVSSTISERISCSWRDILHSRTFLSVDGSNIGTFMCILKHKRCSFWVPATFSIDSCIETPLCIDTDLQSILLGI